MPGKHSAKRGTSPALSPTSLLFNKNEFKTFKIVCTHEDSRPLGPEGFGHPGAGFTGVGAGTQTRALCKDELSACFSVEPSLWCLC